MIQIFLWSFWFLLVGLIVFSVLFEIKLDIRFRKWREQRLRKKADKIKETKP